MAQWIHFKFADNLGLRERNFHDFKDFDDFEAIFHQIFTEQCHGICPICLGLA
jgi:hypothetical protein